MKYRIALLLILSVSRLWAQEKQYQIISTTLVYSQPDRNSKLTGIYARGGVAFLEQNIGREWAKIRTENGSTGYIPSRFLTETLNGKDTYEQDPPEFVRPGDKDAQMGCPHLYITGAAVRGRAIYRNGQPATHTYRTNEPVCVNYLPYDENALVRVDGHWKQDMIFVPRKFLGRRLGFKKSLDAFNAAKDPAQRKQLAERIYEMCWREQKADNLQGIQAFRTYARETGNKQLEQSLQFEEFLLQHTRQSMGVEERTALFTGKPLRFRIGQQALPQQLTEQNVEAITLPKQVLTDGKDYPECGVEVTKEYRFELFTVYHSSTENLTYIPELRFDGSKVGITIAGITIDGNTTEAVFVEKLGRLIDYDWLNTPHEYTIGDDGETLVFTFKNGRPVSFRCYFMC